MAEVLAAVSNAAFAAVERLHVERLSVQAIKVTYESGLRDEPGIREKCRWPSLSPVL
jgi:hypothetical protein